MYILKQTYPGSVVKVKRIECDKFLYTFVALEACIRGWEYCRPIVVVDGAGLKCSYGGTMFTASTMDPGGNFLSLVLLHLHNKKLYDITYVFNSCDIFFKK